MTKFEIKLSDGNTIVLWNENMSFHAICEEITLMPFYILRKDNGKGNMLIARDHIVSITLK